MVNPANLPGDARLHDDARLHSNIHVVSNGPLALDNAPVVDLVAAAMWEELGVSRLDELPLADRGRVPGRHLPMSRPSPAVTNNPWAHHKFDDNDPSLEGLDDMHGGMLYRERRAAEAAAQGRQSGNAGPPRGNASGRGSAMSRGVGGRLGAHGTRPYSTGTPARGAGSARANYDVNSTIARLRNPPEVQIAPSSRGSHQQAVSNRPAPRRNAHTQAPVNQPTTAQASVNVSGPSRFASGSNLASADAFMAHMAKSSRPVANKAASTTIGSSTGPSAQVPAQSQGLASSQWASDDSVATSSSGLPTSHVTAVSHPSEDNTSRRTVADVQGTTPLITVTAPQVAVVATASQPVPDTTPLVVTPIVPVKIKMDEDKNVKIMRNSGPTQLGSVAFYTVGNNASTGVLEFAAGGNFMSGPVSEHDILELTGSIMKYRPVGEGSPTWRTQFQLPHLAMRFYTSVSSWIKSSQNTDEDVAALQVAPSSNVHFLPGNPSTVALTAESHGLDQPKLIDDLDTVETAEETPKIRPSKSALDLMVLDIGDNIIENLFAQLNSNPKQSYLDRCIHTCGSVWISLDDITPDLLAGAEFIVSALLSQSPTFQFLDPDIQTAYIADVSKRTLKLALKAFNRIEPVETAVVNQDTGTKDEQPKPSNDSDDELSDTEYDNEASDTDEFFETQETLGKEGNQLSTVQSAQPAVSADTSKLAAAENCDHLTTSPEDGQDVFHDAASKFDNRTTYATQELYGLRNNPSVGIQGELAQKPIYKLISPTRSAGPPILSQSTFPPPAPFKPANSTGPVVGGIKSSIWNPEHSKSKPSLSQVKPVNATSFGQEFSKTPQEQSDSLRGVVLSAVRGEGVTESHASDSGSKSITTGVVSSVVPNIVKSETAQGSVKSQHRTGLSLSLEYFRLEGEILSASAKKEEDKSSVSVKTEIVTDSIVTPRVAAVSENTRPTATTAIPSIDQVLHAAPGPSGSSNKIDFSKMGGLSSSIWANDPAPRVPLVKRETTNHARGDSASSLQSTSHNPTAHNLAPDARPFTPRPAVQVPTMEPVKATVIVRNSYTGQLEEVTGFLKVGDLPVIAHSPVNRQENVPYPTGPSTGFNQSFGGITQRPVAHDRNQTDAFKSRSSSFGPQSGNNNCMGDGSVLSPQQEEVQTRLAQSMTSRFGSPPPRYR